MSNPQSAHQALSLFGFASKFQTFSKQLLLDTKLLRIVRAFFVAVVVLIALAAASQFSLIETGKISVATMLEPVGFQPGQYISPRVTPGYIGQNQ